MLPLGEYVPPPRPIQTSFAKKTHSPAELLEVLDSPLLGEIRPRFVLRVIPHEEDNGLIGVGVLLLWEGQKPEPCWWLGEGPPKPLKHPPPIYFHLWGERSDRSLFEDGDKEIASWELPARSPLGRAAFWAWAERFSFGNPLDGEDDDDDSPEEKAAKAIRFAEGEQEKAAFLASVESFFWFRCAPPALFSQNAEGAEAFLETWGAEAEGGFSSLFSVSYDSLRNLLEEPPRKHFPRAIPPFF